MSSAVKKASTKGGHKLKPNDDTIPSAEMDAAISSSHQGPLTIMTLIVFLGLGSFAGLGVFHTIFRGRCLDEPDSNSTLETLHQKLMTSIADHKRCLDDDSHLEELHTLRGRLESQSDIISLLSREVQGIPKVNELQNQIQQTTVELSSVLADFQAATIEKLELERALESEREFSARIVQKNEYYEAKLVQSHAIESNLISLQESQDGIVNHTRQRQGVMCRQL